MHVKIRIREGNQPYLPNPDYAIERIHRHRVEMPGGFSFGLTSLKNLSYPQRGHGCLMNGHNFTLEFTIPIGFVTGNQGQTPSFPQQCTTFETKVDKYTLTIETRNEVQTL